MGPALKLVWLWPYQPYSVAVSTHICVTVSFRKDYYAPHSYLSGIALLVLAICHAHDAVTQDVFTPITFFFCRLPLITLPWQLPGVLWSWTLQMPGSVHLLTLKTLHHPRRLSKELDRINSMQYGVVGDSCCNGVSQEYQYYICKV